MIDRLGIDHAYWRQFNNFPIPPDHFLTGRRASSSVKNESAASDAWQPSWRGEWGREY